MPYGIPDDEYVELRRAQEALGRLLRGVPGFQGTGITMDMVGRHVVEIMWLYGYPIPAIPEVGVLLWIQLTGPVVLQAL